MAHTNAGLSPIMVPVENDLVPWLTREKENRGWSMRELARRAGTSHTTVSDVLSYQRKPTWDFCAGVAQAFNMPVDEVFVLAGLKRPAPPPVEEEREAIRILRSLQASVRATVITMLRALARDKGLPVGVNEPAVPYVTDDRYVRELLEEFAQVPEDWQEMVIAQARQYRLMAETRPMHIIGEEDLERKRGTETT